MCTCTKVAVGNQPTLPKIHTVKDHPLSKNYRVMPKLTPRPLTKRIEAIPYHYSGSYARPDHCRRCTQVESYNVDDASSVYSTPRCGCQMAVQTDSPPPPPFRPTSSFKELTREDLPEEVLFPDF